MSIVKMGVSMAVLSIVATLPAKAEIIVEDSGLFSQTGFNSQGVDAIDFAQFNASLGELAGATVTLTGITQPQLELLNLGALAGSGSGSTAVVYTLTGPGIAGLETPSLSSGIQTVSVPGGFGNISSSPAGTPQFFDVTFSISDLADYVGAGDVTLDLSELFTTSVTPLSGTVAGGGTASANFDVQLTYDVPEPATLAVFGVGLVGLGLMRRRRVF
jgi:hypothetical protein